MYTDNDGYLEVPSINSIANGITNELGFAWDSYQGIWYSVMNASQRSLGYCDLYDTCAPLAGIHIDHKKIPFKYNGKEWMIWLWKGLYGITTGAEIGVYVYNCTKSISYLGKTAKMKWYRAAYDSEVKNLNVSMTIYKNGNKLFSRNASGAWWITGFKLGMSFWWDKLKMDASITFPNADMANAFRKSLGWNTSTSCIVNFTW